MSTLTTKVTRLQSGYGCRIFDNGNLVLEGNAPSRLYIGAVFRDLLRTLDKCGGDNFTRAARKRKYAPLAPVISVKHKWGGT